MPDRRSFLDRFIVKCYLWTTELLYHQIAWAYDLAAWIVSFGYWSRWRVDALAYLKPGSVLETGFGTGSLLIALTEHGFNPIGLECSPEMHQVARRKMKRRGIFTRRVMGRTEAVPFPVGTFMNVLSTFPANYIAKEQTIKEVKRVLNDEGRWVIVGLSVAFKSGFKCWMTNWLLHDSENGMVQHFIARAEGLGLRTRVVEHQAAEYSLDVVILEKSHD